MPNEIFEEKPEETHKAILRKRCKALLEEISKAMLEETPKAVLEETPKAGVEETPKAVLEERSKKTLNDVIEDRIESAIGDRFKIAFEDVFADGETSAEYFWTPPGSDSGKSYRTSIFSTMAATIQMETCLWFPFKKSGPNCSVKVHGTFERPRKFRQGSQRKECKGSQEDCGRSEEGTGVDRMVSGPRPSAVWRLSQFMWQDANFQSLLLGTGGSLLLETSPVPSQVCSHSLSQEELGSHLDLLGVPDKPLPPEVEAFREANSRVVQMIALIENQFWLLSNRMPPMVYDI